LVSTYNHILEQHDGKDDPKKNEKPLTPDERKKLMSNLQGYDIDPTMVRIAQVNMYLHQFKNPQIFQYDSLTSEERWNDKYDVILANPPFMSPKGGIKPHNKFGVASNRAEVLFVDYIINHLKPKGRAGIVVPEGVIFQNGNSYKALRKNLVENGLYSVVSLPAGVFQPYSGVKTSVLFLDNDLAKQKSEIVFIKIVADGFDLGSNKRVILENDLPQALEILNSWALGDSIESPLVTLVDKGDIAAKGDFNLSAERYKIGVDNSNNIWPMIKLGEVCKPISPPAKIPSTQIKEVGKYQVIDQSQNLVAGWTDDETALVNPGRGLLIFGDHTCATKYVTQQFAQGADGIKILDFEDSVLPKYVFHVLQARPIESEGYKRHFAKFNEQEIPIPPLEVQSQIVAELDGYMGIISGAQQIVDNWRPRIDADPEWPLLKLEDVARWTSGGTPKAGTPEYYGGDISWCVIGDLNEDFVFVTKDRITELGLKASSAKVQPKGTVMLAMYGASIGKTGIMGTPMATNQAIACGQVDRGIISELFLLYYLQSQKSELVRASAGGAQPNISQGIVKGWPVPVPSIEVQELVLSAIAAEKIQIESAKNLIDIYKARTQKVVAKLWSEN